MGRIVMENEKQEESIAEIDRTLYSIEADDDVRRGMMTSKIQLSPSFKCTRVQLTQMMVFCLRGDEEPLGRQYIYIFLGRG